jgi:hypothetical protein
METKNQQMKVYKKLQLPKDSAWDRKTWRRYAHWRIKFFIDGVKNLFRWAPIIYKDRDFDDYYILKMLQKKIEFQRQYLIDQNRHTHIDCDNYWMTLVLNLLEREIHNYYALEMYDYMDSTIKFVPFEDSDNSYKMEKITISENLDDYLNKYRLSKRIVIRKNKGKDFTDKETLAFYIGEYNSKKCRNLLFEILKNKSNQWWD